MRAPRRRRPLRRTLDLERLPAEELRSLAERVEYIGSPEHKDQPSFAGHPRPRADATICDQSFANRLEEILRWLRDAVERGCVGAPWEGDFPRYVWYKDGDDVYEARLVNRERGQYKGYRLMEEEAPQAIDELFNG